ncbi:uncharacterized protein LOC128199528 isoform X2 [Bicyclus anynana]|uniref:Uncharacterized protein LOC128199528 isoform X2 n=1 Tax=Bicyclus anynana TaxID=110368 RepID=A0ABM3M1U8_BICAN|nr:uncharacterized protein LOC128199528 isoform X2 [Bicyclus anynana]
MGLFKCCVGGCNATSETQKLYSFPKNDNLRSLWLSFLVPTNSLLIGLSKDQLIRKRVCEKHFDKQQFDEEGKRLRYSYPCLLTDVEIAHGEPRPSTGAVLNSLNDHNYYKEDSDEHDDVTDALLVIGRAAEVLEQHSCSYNKEVESLATSVQSLSQSTRKLKTFQKKKKSQHNMLIKKLESSKKKFIEQVTEISSETLDKTFKERIEKATLYGTNIRLFKNFDYLNKQAQKFLMMQLRVCRLKKHVRRFSLDEKLLSLTLMKQSPKSYKLLENIFNLPTKRTLNRLSEKIEIEPGLNFKVFEFIRNKIKNWNTDKKLCTIVFDEISLTPHLTYNEKSDEIYGFVDVAEERKKRFCDHALVFMVRGICSPWRQCIAFYFCEGTVSAAALQNIIKQLVSQTVLTGLIPIALVCDQGSTFRTAIKAFREDTVRNRNIQNIKNDGTINIAGQNLSVFFDPPHLLKGIRNNFLNKNIIWKGKKATWKDIEFIFDVDSKLGHTRALPKLTEHHVNPDKIKKMKVSVAAQALSARTAAMLKYTNAVSNLHTGHSSTMETTAEVVAFIDKLFDSVNCKPGCAKKGKLRKAVKNNSKHHSFWTEAIEIIKELKFEDSSSKIAVKAGRPRLVRVPSLEGWITTLESFIRISKLLFEKYSIEYFYPRFINQDPLENFFGRIRSLNYRNINPDANTFLHAFKSLVLTNLLSPHSKFANCEVDDGDSLLDVNFLFESSSNDKENRFKMPSTSQQQQQQILDHNSPSGSLKDEIILEKIKVQCSAYTAGFLCRKLTKKNQCKSCLKTYTSSSTNENIYAYIKFREYEMLKNDNLAYPSENFIMMYRDGSNLIHKYLNKNACEKNIGKNLKKMLNKSLRFSWLGCCSSHTEILKSVFFNSIIRLHVHNWCNIINKILKGDIKQKYVSKMADIHKSAYEKYKKLVLRNKSV